MFALWTAVTSVSPLAGQVVPFLPVRHDLRIDGAAADLSRTVHLAVGRDGTIIVAQPDDHHLRFYSPTGKEIGRFGRRGEGPGEFQSMGVYAGWVGESFWQGNVWPARLVMVGPTRALQRTLTLPPLRPQTRLLFHTVIGLLPGANVVIQGTLARAPSNPTWARRIRDSLATVVLLVDSSGTIRSLVAVAPELEAGCMTSVNGRQRPAPECMKWFGAISPNSDRYVWVQPRVGPGASGTMRVTSIHIAGDTAYARDIPIPLERIVARQSDSIRAARIAGATGEQLRQDYAAMKLPTFFRPVHGIVAGSDGRTWIALRGQGSERSWLVLSPTGAVVGRVRIPENVRVVVADATHFWGIETDEDGIHSVVRYRIG
ncbi:MAG: hypothetical protein SFU84_08625 [Gemmatimonadales bacterium]|nr:hypothetical protein [Gemmatimonadales bacterium]